MPFGRHLLLQWVCCCGPNSWEILIDRCTAGGQQRRRAHAGSAALSAYVVAKHILVYIYLRHHTL